MKQTADKYILYAYHKVYCSWNVFGTIKQVKEIKSFNMKFVYGTCKLWKATFIKCFAINKQ